MHSSLPTVVLVATKVHVILRRYVVLTWMHDNRDFVVECDIMEEHNYYYYYYYHYINDVGRSVPSVVTISGST